MIQSLKIQNFKSFKDVELELGSVNVLIGTNASGKSNFLDALRLLQGIGLGYSLPEIIDGKPKSTVHSAWEPIRGGSHHLAFYQNPNSPISFGLKISHALWNFAFCPNHFQVLRETYEGIYDTECYTDTSGEPRLCVKEPEGSLEYDFPADRLAMGFFTPPILHSQVRETVKTLKNIQHLNPSPSQLRQYSQTPTQSVQRMGEQGENFAALVEQILSDENSKTAYLEWLQHLRPEEIDDIQILHGAMDEALFALKEGDSILPAEVLSDGTLRFAAIASALFQPDMPSMITMEEIENGIHPNRLRLLLELLRSQATHTGTQLFLTTHSPTLLSWLTQEDAKYAFHFKRDEETGESHISPLSALPQFQELQEKQAIGDLFAEGWMEFAV